MTRLGLDFESYWAPKYSLKTMPTLEYVRDERFKIHGAAVKIDDEETKWVSEPDLSTLFGAIDWSTCDLICHNTYFDGLILFEHYRKIPARYLCTLSMGRAMFPFISHSLDSLGETLGVGRKTTGVLAKTKGLKTLTPELEEELGGYACQDVEVMMGVYDRLVEAFPQDELDLLDLTLRWGCVPTLRVDLPRAQAALNQTLVERKQTIEASGVSEKILGSNPQFAQHLISLNITPPVKISPTTNEPTYAFAKQDVSFIDLMADNPGLRSLWDARLAAKSNLLRTRTSRIIKIGEGSSGAGTLPMPLKYCGAHTLRWSGQDGLNPQNFPRDSELRRSIVAPPGYRIVVGDLAQIELRLNFWFSGQNDLLDVFRTGHDIYKTTAARHFHCSYDEVTPGQRWFGKLLDLGLGYGMGAVKFRRTCALKGIYMTELEAADAVQNYRYAHNMVRQAWRTCTAAIYTMYHGREGSIKCVGIRKEAIVLPNGMSLSYPNLTPHENNQWTYGGAKPKKIYGALLLENIIQALARVVLGEMMLEIQRHPDINIVSSTHDEIIALARAEKADWALDYMLGVMGQSPDWAPDLPLCGEGAHETYYCK